jgi:hypothetical protein
VTRVLIAALVALIVSILIGPRFIAFLRRNEFGQHIREEGPEHHFAKQGTPTMGGLMILFAATLAFLPVSHYTLQGLTVLFATLACGAIGFLDDFIKLTHRRSLGLSGRWKMLMLLVVAVIVSLVADHLKIEHSVFVPILNVNVPLSYVWYPFIFLIIARTANATNLADGVDGSQRVRRSSRSSHSPRSTSSRTCARRPIPRTATSQTSISRSSVPRSWEPRSASSGTTRSPPRSSWATPVRWRSAAPSRASRS